MNETTKAFRRRWREDQTGNLPFKWCDVFQGNGLDVGCGPDKAPLPACRGFDEEDGDANHLSRHIALDSLDYLHGSQCLEHMHNPSLALRDWLLCVKRGGYVVQTVPCWELYEGMVWPSGFNYGHKSTWSMWQPGSPAEHHCKMPEWLNQFGCEVLLCRLVDANFDYSIGRSRDQSYENDVECWIEFVIRKP